VTRRRWLGLAIAVAVAAVGAFVLLRARPAPSSSSLIDEFHAVERHCLQTFNDALHRQAANQLDELGLADVVDRDVLPPWSAFRARVAALPVPADHAALFTALRRYLDDRETAWRAFSAALHAPDDTAARPHYATYHQKDADATRSAQQLAPLL
jgi:hypothetical protein